MGEIREIGEVYRNAILQMAMGSLLEDRPKLAQGRAPVPVVLTILSGEELYHYLPVPTGDESAPFENKFCRFVFDLAQTVVPDRLVIDYNHDDTEVIGALNQITITESALIGRGALLPFADGDRASEVVFKMSTVPYGVSPTVSFAEASVLLVPEGESVTVNAREYAGPILVFRGARIEGVAICPYPTDGGTTVDKLKATHLEEVKNMGFFTTKKPAPEPVAELAEEVKNDVVEAGGDGENGTPQDGGSAPTDAVDGAEGAEAGAGVDQEQGAGGGETGGDGDAVDAGDGGNDAGANLANDSDHTLAANVGGDEIVELRKEVDELKEMIAALSKRTAGEEPVSHNISVSGEENLSYEEAISARLDSFKSR